MADDPFFADEDDGDFDDLYGKPAPALSPPRKGDARRRDYEDEYDYDSEDNAYLRGSAPPSRPSPVPKSRTTFADTPSNWQSSQQQQPRPSASVVSSQVGEAEIAEKKTRSRGRKARRKGSQELFDVDWEDESRVPACSICASGFSLVRRKHHCRPCGRVMCSDCSSFLFFELSQRKHRVCSACAANHSAATRAARQSQRDALFDRASDSEPQLTPMGNGTPSSVTPNARGFRASVLHAVTPTSGNRDKKSTEKKTTKNSVAFADQQRTTASDERRRDAVIAKDTRDQGYAPGLFNVADDAWFNDPVDEGEGKHKQAPTPEMGRAFPDADYSEGFADSTNSNSRTAADDWRDQVKASYELQLDPTVRSAVAAPSSGFGFRRNDFAEQYHYDDDDSLDYGEDDKIGANYTDLGVSNPSMPRPEPAVSFVSRPEPTPTAKTPQHVPPAEEPTPDHLRQSVLKMNVKGLFHGKSKKEKRRRKTKDGRAERQASQRSEERSPVAAAAEAQTSVNERMVLDELAYTPKPATTGASAIRPTFYDDDADELVADDTPGYFEANLAKTYADNRKKEELERKLAEDSAWINGVAGPSSGNRFSSGQDSFSIVDHPSHGNSSPESANNKSPPTTHEEEQAKQHRFSGALKRFFGMASAKKREKTPPAPTQAPKPIKEPEPAETPAPLIEEVAPRRSLAVNNEFEAEDRALSFRRTVGGVTQLSVYDRQAELDGDALRYTMAGDLDAQRSIRPSTFMVPNPQPVSTHHEPKQTTTNRSLKRRDTFDDLFESPKALERHTDASSGLPTRSWGEVAIESMPAYAVGVSRFDTLRDDREDEPDDFMPASTPSKAVLSRRDSPSNARYNSEPTLKPRRDSDDAFGSPTKPTSTFTWSNVQAAPGFGTASYAVPAGVPPRDSRFGNDRFASRRANSDDEDARTPHNIMQDLHQGSGSAGQGHKQSAADSVDDIFAQFERPNDYVFDAATESYVPARPVPRATRREKEVSSAPRQSYDPNDVAGARSSVGRRSSERVRGESTYEANPGGPQSKDRGEDSDSNGSDDVIVDKISSLEGELAALKRLIKKRKGGSANSNLPRSASTKRMAKAPSTSSAKPRKESIFDGDSSESDKEMPGSRWPAPSTRRSKGNGVNLQPRKARRDSFASLFDEDPEEGDAISGAGGYDALFQTGPSKSDESDGDDNDESQSPVIRRSKKRNPSKKATKKDVSSSKPSAFDDVNAQDDDEDVELASLKNKRSILRRRRSSKELRAPSFGDDSAGEAPFATATDRVPEVTTLSIAPGSLAPKAAAVDDEDSIDALFDTADDVKMVDLYGEDAIATTDDHNEAAVPEKARVRRPSSRRSKTRRRLSDGDSDENAGSTTPSTAPVKRQDSANGSSTSLAMNSAALTPMSVSLADTSDPDSDEEFAINWKKVKSGRARRQTRPSAALTSSVSFMAVTSVDVLSTSDEEMETTAEPTREVNETLVISHGAIDGAADSSSEEEADTLGTANEPLTSPHVDGTETLRGDQNEAAPDSPTTALDDESSRLPTSVDAHEMEDAASSKELGTSTATEQMTDADSPLAALTTPSFSRFQVDDDLFKDDSDDRGVSMDLFARSNDMDLHSLMGGSTTTLYDEDFTISKPDASPLPTSSPSVDEPDVGDASTSGEDDADDVGFSFEIKPQRRRTVKPSPVEAAASRSSSVASTATADDDDQSSVLLGKYARASLPRVESSPLDDSIQLGASFSSVDTNSEGDFGDGNADASRNAAAEGDALAPGIPADSVDAFDTDWQAMQEQEKQRKKKLQMKQRQAQRDKLMLKKQHSKMLASSATDASADGKSGTKKKKKKKPSKDDSAAPSSRKHRHREKEEREPDAAAGSLTEL